MAYGTAGTLLYTDGKLEVISYAVIFVAVDRMRWCNIFATL